MGTSQRGPLSQLANTPGPGSYLQKGKIGEGPRYGLRPKTAVIMRQDVPGPGQYDPSKRPVQARPPSAVMGHGSRAGDLAGGKGVPGPGSYLNSAQIKGNPAYTFGGSRVYGKGSDMPGPGTYRVPYTFARNPNYALPSRSHEFDFV